MIKFDSEKKYTQQYVDSLTISQKFPYSNSDFKKILEANNLFGWTYYYNRLAGVVFNKGEIDSSIYFSNLALKAFNNAHIKRDFDEQHLVRTYTIKATALKYKEEFNKSIKLYQKALVLNEKYPFKWKGYIFNGIGDNHLNLGNNKFALNYILKAVNDSLFMSAASHSIVYNKLGMIYSELNNIKLAKYYYLKGLKSLKNIDSDKSDFVSINGRLGVLYHYENKKDSALYHFKQAIEANQKYGLKSYDGAEIDNLFYESYINVFNGETDKAIKKLKFIIKDNNSLEKITFFDKKLMVIAIELLGNAYQKQKNYTGYQPLLQETFSFLEKYHNYRLKENINKLELEYQSKKKDESISQLEKNQKQQETIINQQKIIAIGLGGLLFLGLIITSILWRQRKLKNQYEKENLQQRLLRSQMNPHFVFNTLNSISGLVEKKSDKTIPYINKLAILFRLILTNSREEFVSLEDEVITLKNYLELQSDFSKKFHFNIIVDNDIDQDELLIPPMFIQPFIENSIIHGFSEISTKGKIQITIKKDEKNSLLFCKIEDNGVGFEKSNTLSNKNHSSVSTKIINERLINLKKKFKVKARLSIKKNKNNGTLVELYLPFLID